MCRISVLVITKNEAANISACLETVTWADEIVVVDSGSTDETVTLARKYTPLVFSTKWRGYSGTKQWGLEKTTGEWVFWLDADERVSPKLAEEIRAAVRQAKEIDGFLLPRCAFFLGRWIKHSGWYPGYVLRLIRREQARFCASRVHEYLEPPSNVAKLKTPLLHFTDRTIFHYFEKFNTYTSLAAEDLLEKGKKFRVFDLLLRPVHVFCKMYIFKLGFLDGFQGFLLAVFSSMYVFTKYAKLWELQRMKADSIEYPDNRLNSDQL